MRETRLESEIRRQKSEEHVPLRGTDQALSLCMLTTLKSECQTRVSIRFHDPYFEYASGFRCFTFQIHHRTHFCIVLERSSKPVLGMLSSCASLMLA